MIPCLVVARHGVSYTFEGQHAQIIESLESLTSGFIMAMIAVYAILAGMLGSYVQPLIIMAAVPVTMGAAPLVPPKLSV